MSNVEKTLLEKVFNIDVLAIVAVVALAALGYQILPVNVPVLERLSQLAQGLYFVSLISVFASIAATAGAYFKVQTLVATIEAKPKEEKKTGGE